MKLACADFTFPKLDHTAALKLIALMDFKGADIGLFEGRSHLWPSREFKNGGRSGKKLKRQLDDLNLQAADIFLQMDPDFSLYAINHPQSSRRTKAREWYCKALEYAVHCGCRHVTVLPGVRFDGESFQQSFKRSCTELAWRVERARDAGVVLGTEAHVGSLVDSPTLAEKLVRSVPGLSLTLDYTHFTRAGMSDSQIESLIPYASHFHARGARKNRLQTSFKENTINYARVMRKMRSAGYRGWIGVEYVWIDWEHCNECDNISETVLLRDFLRTQPL